MRIRSALAALLIVLGLTSAAHAIIVSYGYDTAGRLTVANYGGTSSTSYTYDANGNLLARTNRVNPFLPLLGTYTGLVTSGTPSATNTGMISLTIAAKGVTENPFTAQFTGTLKLGGASYKIRGSFDATGAATITVERKAPLAALMLNLQLDLDSGGILTGTISGGETAGLAAMLTPFTKKAPAPSGLAGPYTALFEPTQSGTTIPHGDGFATVTVSSSGAVKIAGTLADGSKLSLGTALASDGTCPLFLPLYKNTGFLVGTATFSVSPGVSDFAGTLDWDKFQATSASIYPATFSTQVNLVGSNYAKPAKNQRVLDLPDTASNARFTTDGGNSTALD
jgi:YD repeat-containing protein